MRSAVLRPPRAGWGALQPPHQATWRHRNLSLFGGAVGNDVLRDAEQPNHATAACPASGNYSPAAASLGRRP